MSCHREFRLLPNISPSKLTQPAPLRLRREHQSLPVVSSRFPVATGFFLMCIRPSPPVAEHHCLLLFRLGRNTWSQYCIDRSEDERFVQSSVGGIRRLERVRHTTRHTASGAIPLFSQTTIP